MSRQSLPDEKIIAAEKKPFWQRLGWLLAIWCLSVLALAVVGGLLRLLMRSAGMTTP